MPEVDRQIRDMLITGLELGALVIAALLAVLGVMCWQHQATALVGIGIGLVLSIGSVCLLCWRLGRLSQP